MTIEKTEHNNNNVEDNVEQQKQQEIDYKDFYEKNKGIVENKNKILGEKKSLQSEYEKLKERLDKYESQEHEGMKEQGQFKPLWETEQKKRMELEEKNKNLLNELKKDRLERNAIEIANDLAKSNSNNAKILKHFVEQSLQEHADEYGNIDGNVISTVREQFLNDDTYSSLIGGLESSGGGAPGNSGKTNNAKKYSDMSEAERTTLYKENPEKYRRLRDEHFKNK